MPWCDAALHPLFQGALPATDSPGAALLCVLAVQGRSLSAGTPARAPKLLME